MKFQIKNRWTRAVQFECELPTKYESKSYGVQLGAAVKIAVGARANLADAYLAGVDLTDANLTRANLMGAILAGANLMGAILAGADLASAYLTDANLTRANLMGAILAGADLARADLTGAYLTSADLTGAYLASANLTDANLSGAYLTDAYLTDANLSGANLTDANLSGAYLTDANLTSANLASANLTSANLTPIRDDLFAVLSYVPGEVTALISALEAGRVNGSTYSDGECGCLVGTLAIAAGADPKNKNRCELVRGLQGNSSRPIERFFLGIKRGDTPENNQFARLAHGWACEWLARMRAAFGYEILVRQDRIEQLERQVDRLKSIASNGWIEAWHCGNQFMALPPDDDHETVLRCWEESQTKRELSKLN